MMGGLGLLLLEWTLTWLWFVQVCNIQEWMLHLYLTNQARIHRITLQFAHRSTVKVKVGNHT
jgi:hypothetical protein